MDPTELSKEAARAARLRYVTDGAPGIRRVGKTRFRYVAPNGAAVRDPETLARVRSLAIPPAWTDVWICPLANGHIQAVGRDAKGRKQYRYHPRWREERDASKFGRMLSFAEALKPIRATVERDLERPGLPREKILATVVRLLEMTCIRVGNEEYARDNHSFGLTTLRNRHVDVEGATLRFRFRGKSGKVHSIDVRDRRIARIVRRCEELPGQHLFEYVGEDGEPHPVESDDVNAYIRDASGGDFTAKDFRTLQGTVLAARALRASEACASQSELKKTINAAIRSVAQRLGNTLAVCKRSYVHPAVIEAYSKNLLGEDVPDVREEEAVVLRLVEKNLLPGLDAACTAAE